MKEEEEQNDMLFFLLSGWEKISLDEQIKIEKEKENKFKKMQIQSGVSIYIVVCDVKRIENNNFNCVCAFTKVVNQSIKSFNSSSSF